MMLPIVNALVQQVTNVAQNQFLSGGLVLGLIGSLLVVAKALPEKLWGFVKLHCSVTVDVSSLDPGYEWLLSWLQAHRYGKTSRRVSIKHIKTKDGESRLIFIPSKGEHWFWYKYRPLWLSRMVEKSSGPLDEADLASALNPKELLTIRVLGRSRKLVADLVEEARTAYASTDIGRTYVHRYQWGYWKHSTRMARPMESVFLPEGASGLVADMKNFIKQADWYRKMGIPYRRGYLFTGPPGTGKSSTAEALAGELGIPIHMLNLATLTDTSLENAITQMENTGTVILLLEDIDTVLVERKSPGEQQKISLGTLLNVLDGIQAADNVILIMTSNKPEKLDPALIRKGRVDKSIEFGLASEEQITAAIKRFLPDTTLEQCRQIAEWPRPLSMAEVQERLKEMVVK